MFARRFRNSRIHGISYSTMQTQWTSFIRFKTADGSEKYGQPLDTTFSEAREIVGCPLNGGVVSDNVLKVSKLLAPLGQPPNIVCIGLNYKQHAKETGLPIPNNPIVFYKNTACIQNPEVDYEVELAIVIGKACKNASKENALDYVAGYSVANDVSARRWQGNLKGGSQWCFSKSFDTFCPLGPQIVSKEVIPNPNKLQVSTVLNGRTMQSSNTEDMIFDVPTIIAFVSQSTTLLPGTIILTGVGFTRDPPVYLMPGDSVTVEVENIGKLHNPVVSE